MLSGMLLQATFWHWPTREYSMEFSARTKVQ